MFIDGKVCRVIGLKLLVERIWCVCGIMFNVILVIFFRINNRYMYIDRFG